MKKKFFSLILAFALLFQFMPITTIASESESEGIGLILFSINEDPTIEKEISNLLQKIDKNIYSEKELQKLIDLQYNNSIKIQFEDDLLEKIQVKYPNEYIIMKKFNNEKNIEDLINLENIHNEIKLNATKEHVQDYVEKRIGAKLFGIKGEIIASIRCDVEWWYWSDTSVITNVLPKTTVTKYRDDLDYWIMSSSGTFSPNNIEYRHEVLVYMDYMKNTIFHKQLITELSFHLYRNNIFNTSKAE